MTPYSIVCANCATVIASYATQLEARMNESEDRAEHRERCLELSRMQRVPDKENE